MLPFKYKVTAASGESLNTIARKHALSVDDLHQWNPTILPANCCSETFHVPQGTYLQLPPVLHYRGNVYGNGFEVGDYAQRLFEVRRLQNMLLKDVIQPATGSGEAEESGRSAASSSPPVFTVPQRKILSKHEAAHKAIAETALSQMPAQPSLSACGSGAVRAKGSANAAYVSSALQGVDISDLGERLLAVDQMFSDCPRECLAAHNRTLMSAAPAKKKPNHVSDDRLQTTRDPNDAPIDRTSDVRLIFAFFETRSLFVTKESWAVLASQNIGVLIDAIRCKSMLLSYHTTKNSFFFIGGVFYIDDRHSGYADLTEELRAWDPVRSIVDRVGPSAVDKALLAMKRAYGASPVRLVSQTKFADLRLRLNELCVFRHCATCDHVFYLTHCGPVPMTDAALAEGDSSYVSKEEAMRPLLRTSQFPRRTYLAPDRSVNCDVCSKLPANIATYGDAIAPFNPALFCLPCFRISHCDKEGNEVNDGYVKVELPEGEFF